MLTVETRGFDVWDARLAQTAALMKTPIYRAMDDSTRLVLQQARTNLERVHAVDTRALWHGIDRDIEETSTGLEGHVFFDASVQDYAGVVEFGRQRGAAMPPVEALIPWVRRHQASTGATFSLSTHRRQGSPRVQADQDRNAAFLIARAISRRGIPARPFFVPAYEQSLPAILARFAQARTEVVTQLEGAR